MECSVDQHLSEAELQKRSPFEKYLLQNMKRNYLMTLSVGMPVTKLEFMEEPSARKRKHSETHSDSESDDEWTPDLKTRKKELDIRSYARYPSFSNSSVCDIAEINNSRKNDGDCPKYGDLEITEDFEALSEDNRKSADERSPPSNISPQGGQGIFAKEKIVDQSGETYLSCRRCPDVQLRCETYLLSHMKYKHQVTVPPNSTDKCPNNLSPGTGTNCCGTRTNSRTVCNPGGIKSQQKGKTQSLQHEVNNLKGNNTNQTGSGSKPFKCTMCDYRCTRKDHLDHHMRTHTGEKPFKCTVCDYRCTRKHHLDLHMRTHTGEKPFECTMCEYRCSQKHHLDHHMRTHTGEKPFQCAMCNYRCSVRANLHQHMRTHTGEKPFKCAMCEYRCIQKNSLDRHMRTHTGEKPFKYTMCDYRCNRKTSLEMRTHTSDKPFICTMCDYRCSQKSSLNRHMKRHTGDNM